MATIRDSVAADAQAIARIYNHYIRESIATFEEVEIDAAEIARRMEAVKRQYSWLVAQEQDEVVGYAYASAWHARAAYRYSVETSVYLDPACCGRGIGTVLYEEMLKRLRGMPVRLAIGGVSLPNEASVRLHEKTGFKKAAHYEQVGYKFNRWIDVGYWQLQLPYEPA